MFSYCSNIVIFVIQVLKTRNELLKIEHKSTRGSMVETHELIGRIQLFSSICDQCGKHMLLYHSYSHSSHTES